ncbi:GDSL-type esterase/lipase family protein [Desulfitobacterium sp. Sab5]|uniref:GDSL-type esterase/lipase family protein n=1 Tax=Desulfitobacterium nosdiversum TaxID=3375356 RepID=UPI003CF6867F
MRTYRLEIRLIQLTVLLSVFVVAAGFLGAWGNSKGSVASSASSSNKTSETRSVQNTNTNTNANANAKIVALGDSFTYGYPAGPDHSWVGVLGENLNTTVLNKGKVFQTSKDMLSRFDADVVSEKPGRVIIFAGNGDALRNISLKEFQSNVQAIVDKSRSNHITPLLALPMPYPGAQEAITDMRNWIEEYAQTERFLVLDFASAVMDSNGKYLKGYSDNNKYPSIKGYQAMGEYAARVLK